MFLLSRSITTETKAITKFWYMNDPGWLWIEINKNNLKSLSLKTDV